MTNIPEWAIVDAEETLDEVILFAARTTKANAIACAIMRAYERGVSSERERCAKVVETLTLPSDTIAQHVVHAAGHRIAAAIRKGEQQ